MRGDGNKSRERFGGLVLGGHAPAKGIWLLTHVCIRWAMICKATLRWGTLASLFYAVIYCPALAPTIYHTELAVTDENDPLEKLSHLSLSQPVN